MSILEGLLELSQACRGLGQASKVVHQPVRCDLAAAIVNALEHLLELAIGLQVLGALT
jgi:hypothetical protein